MTDLLNPYAPPSAELRVDLGEHCWRDGKIVVLGAGHDFPPRCVCCNAPATPAARARRFSWHSPWLFLLILLNILIYIVVALLARRSVKLHPALCDMHQEARRRGRLTGSALFIVGLGILFGAALDGFAAYFGLEEAGFAAGVLLMLAGLWVASRVPANLSAARIDKYEMRLRGAGEPFLASLPPYLGLPPPGIR